VGYRAFHAMMMVMAVASDGFSEGCDIDSLSMAFMSISSMIFRTLVDGQISYIYRLMGRTLRNGEEWRSI